MILELIVFITGLIIGAISMFFIYSNNNTKMTDLSKRINEKINELTKG